MSNYRVHVYIVREEPYDHNREICIRRENLDNGEFHVLRHGSTNWPEAIVKTLVQVNMPAMLYDITQEQFERNAWDEATVIPEEQW